MTPEAEAALSRIDRICDELEGLRQARIATELIAAIDGRRDCKKATSILKGVVIERELRGTR